MVKELKTKVNKNEEELKISAIWEASATLLSGWEKGAGDYSAAATELTNLNTFIGDGQSVHSAEEHIDR
jgi:hypothetical protein